MTPVWFARFAAIPGVNYQTPAGLDVSRLAGYGTVPSSHFNQYTQSSHLYWPMANGGSTSRAPAGERAFRETKDMTTRQVLTNVAEALELPGEPSDYHFTLQHAATELYSRRRSEPAAIDEAHRLYLLDLQLIQARPEIAEFDHNGEQRFLTVVGISRLLRMYLAEGRVAEAAGIADVAERFGAGALPDVASARARAAALAAEDRS